GGSTLEQRKEFLRGFVAEIGIDPDAGRGTIVFYELPVTSLMMVPGPWVELLQTLQVPSGQSLPRGPRLAQAASFVGVLNRSSVST
ncbi:MAG: hypothetical protein ACRD6R_02305, partial [Candidatus Polarisedimenticolia bacterium]